MASGYFAFPPTAEPLPKPWCGLRAAVARQTTYSDHLRERGEGVHALLVTTDSDTLATLVCRLDLEEHGGRNKISAAVHEVAKTEKRARTLEEHYAARS
jgi:hypothetical protein